MANRIRAAAKAAGLEGRYSGHSAPVGMACDLLAKGASVEDVQTAGRWAAPKMVLRYGRSELAGRSAVADYYRR